VRQVITEDFGMRKISAEMVPRILADDQKQCRIHISPDLLHSAEMFDRVFTSAEKDTHVSLAVQDHACMFLRSQGDS
jgi:hypothetical protein